MGMFRSVCSSLKIFFSEGGIVLSSVEKARPCAWLSLWYGS